MAAKAKGKPNRELSSLTKGYLISYNVAQVLGWTYLLYLIITYYVSSPKEVPLWDTVKPILVLFQNAAVLEVHTVHRALPHRSDGGASVLVRGPGICSPQEALESGDAKCTESHFQLSLFPALHNVLVHPIVSSDVPSHVCTTPESNHRWHKQKSQVILFLRYVITSGCSTTDFYRKIKISPAYTVSETSLRVCRHKIVMSVIT